MTLPGEPRGWFDRVVEGLIHSIVGLIAGTVGGFFLSGVCNEIVGETAWFSCLDVVVAGTLSGALAGAAGVHLLSRARPRLETGHGLGEDIDPAAARGSCHTWRRLAATTIFVGIPVTVFAALWIVKYRPRVLLHAELPDRSVVEVFERRVPHGISGAFRYYAELAPMREFSVVVDGPRTLDTGPYSDGSVISDEWAERHYIGGLHGWDSTRRRPSAVQIEGERILLLSEDGVAAVLLRGSR